jgi:hypothetical protein
MPGLLVALMLIVSLFAAPAAQPADCPLAPAPRLRVGMPAVVAPGVWGLNLRALPAVSTGVRAQLSAGQRLTITGGPSCNRQFRWFRVELPDGVGGWLAEASWSGYFVVPAREDGTPRQLVSPLDWSCAGRFDSRRCLLVGQG